MGSRVYAIVCACSAATTQQRILFALQGGDIVNLIEYDVVGCAFVAIAVVMIALIVVVMCNHVSFASFSQMNSMVRR